MPIICFFGPDGAGKSTLAKATSQALSEQGFRLKISWMRGTHTGSSLLAKFLSNFAVFRGSDNPYFDIAIPLKLRPLWQLIEFISALPVILLKFVVPSALGYWIVAERYLPDFITWVSITTHDEEYHKSYSAVFLLSLMSRVRTKIYVSALCRELINRRSDTDPDFLSKQLNLYGKIASAIHAKRLDTTSKDADMSLKEVLNIINSS